MSLFTVIIHFSDHRNGIDQFETDSPLEALKQMISLSESLEGYDREQILLTASEYTLVHIASEMKGFWISGCHTTNHTDEDSDVIGGYIIQTDPLAPIRKK